MATYAPHYRHDIFVSYAHVDNEPLAGADTRWVTNLITGLKPLLGQKLGRADAYSLWMDYELRGHEALTPYILEQLQGAAILLLILSPGYLASEWCRRELSAFVSKADKGAGRLFVVEREPLERPEELRDVLGYRFWVRNEAYAPRTLGVPRPSYDEFEFYLRLDELARHIVDKLRHLRTPSGPAAVPSPAPAPHVPASASQATVFLAEVTDDLHELRAEVEGYLQRRSIRVLPSTLYYFPSATELRQAIDADLRESTLFVQLLSPTIPRRPAGMSTPQIQYAAAQAVEGLPILQWRDRKVDVAAMTDPDQRAFLDAATVVVTGLEEFKQYIIQQLEAIEAKKRLEEERRQHEASLKQTTPTSALTGDTLVFINTGPEDLSLALEMGEILKEEGFGFSLPLLDDISPAEKRQDLEENLLDCDAVILLYASTAVAWVREQLRYCRRMQGRRDRPLKIIAVFSKANNQPLGMSLPNVQVLEFSSLRESNCVPLLVQALQP
jgi:TIR domain